MGCCTGCWEGGSGGMEGVRGRGICCTYSETGWGGVRAKIEILTGLGSGVHQVGGHLGKEVMPVGGVTGYALRRCGSG